MGKRIAMTLLLASTLLGMALAELSGPRKLLQVEGVRKNFPFRRCVKDAEAAPFLLEGSAPTQTTEGDMMLSWKLVPNDQTCGGSDSCPSCHAGLTDGIHKLVLRSGAACAQAKAVKAVYVNGQRRTGIVSWTAINDVDAVLKLTALDLTGSTIVGSTIDLVVSGPCNTPAAFAPQGGDLMYYLTNSSKVECCPIHSWDWGASQPVSSPVSIDITLPTGYWSNDDLLDQSRTPLKDTDLFQAAAGTFYEGANTQSASIQPVTDTRLGAVATFLFSDAQAAEAAVEALTSPLGDNLQSFISAAKIPCDSLLKVSGPNGLVAKYACSSGDGPNYLPTAALCQGNAPTQYCVTPSIPGEESTEEDSAAEEGSSLDDNEEAGPEPAPELSPDMHWAEWPTRR